MAEGPFDACCKAVYSKIEKAGLGGITESELTRSLGAFANMDRRKRADVLEALMNDRGIECRNQNEGVRAVLEWPSSLHHNIKGRLMQCTNADAITLLPYTTQIHWTEGG
jgi:hypothetical protein